MTAVTEVTAVTSDSSYGSDSSAVTMHSHSVPVFKRVAIFVMEDQTRAQNKSVSALRLKPFEHTLLATVAITYHGAVTRTLLIMER